MRDPGAASGERARGIGRLAPDDPGDPPARRCLLQIRAQQGRNLVPRVAARDDDIGVRGAELAEQLPQHIAELGPGRDAIQQRPVLVLDRVPVDIGQVGDPELMPHDPGRLGVSLVPHRHRIGHEARAAPVDADPVIRAVAVCLVRGRDDGQRAPVAHHQPGAVSAGLEPVHVVGQLGCFPPAEVEPLDDRPRRVVGGLGAADAEVSGERLAQPGQAVLDSPQARVAALRHGQRHDTVGHALGVHAHRWPCVVCARAGSGSAGRSSAGGSSAGSSSAGSSAGNSSSGGTGAVAGRTVSGRAVSSGASATGGRGACGGLSGSVRGAVARLAVTGLCVADRPAAQLRSEW